MEENVDEEFSKLTQELKVEQLRTDMHSRAVTVSYLMELTAAVYKAGRRRGLPRKAAKNLAMQYFESEMSPGLSVVFLEDE